MPHSVAVTDGVRVEVESVYFPERSDPAGGEWSFMTPDVSAMIETMRQILKLGLSQ